LQLPTGGTGLLYLLLAVACSTVIALIFKVSESRDMNRYVITAANYLVASVVSLSFMVLGGVLDIPLSEVPGAFLREAGPALGGEGFSPRGSIAWGVLVGVPSGILYYLGFIYLQKGVRQCGVSLAGSFSKLGVLVPMVLSIALWHEIPSSVQWAGITLALASILLANLDPRSANVLSGFRPVLVLLLLFVGSAEFTNKVYQNYGIQELKSVYLFFVFFVALLVSGVKLARMGLRPRPRHVLTGLAVGVPNYFASFFLILALSRLKTSVVFPVYSAATIVLITIAGAAVFGERLRPRERLAVVMTVVAVALVNVR
jgi:multidrug transporter EmrE-like cation transporter